MNKQGNIMNKKEILEYLELITSELTDAYNSTPDTSDNSDGLYFIDTARDLIGELEDNINGKFDNVPSSDFDERLAVVGQEMKTEKELMGPDRLPLNFPFGDGEGRLKGKN